MVSVDGFSVTNSVFETAPPQSALFTAYRRANSE